MNYKYEKTGDNFRITETKTDSRIATCYLEENARFIVDKLNSLPVGAQVSQAEGVFDVVAMRMVKDLKEVCEELLNVMDIQEKRWSEKFHLSTEAFKPVWDGAKQKALFTLSQMDG